MADVDRKARIAAARKKLKQRQKNNQTGSNVENAHTLEELTVSSAKDESQDSQQHNDSSHFDDKPIMVESSGSLKRAALTDKPIPVVENSTYGPTESSKSNIVTTSSTEKLYSLSRQVTGLVTETTAYLNGDVSSNSNNVDDLERRNQELAERLEELTQMNNALLVQAEDMKQHNNKLQGSLEAERKTFEEKLKRDLGALKEQLQVHVQTVGILVAEKTELQSTCSQAAKLAETRQAEVEELAGRLKASRQRVTDLEKNLSTSNSSNQKLEKSNKELVKDLDKLKLETYKTNKSREELQQHNLELQGRLQQKMHDSVKLEDNVFELKAKLDMSELHLEQLKNGQDRPDSNVAKQIEKILTEKTELQTKLQQQEEAVKMINREREGMMTQYNQYIEQLQQQNKDVQTQAEKLSKERELDALKVEELESHLDQLRTKQAEVTDDRILEHEEKARLMETVENLMLQLMTASKNLEVQVADNSQLSRLVIEKEQTILELEQQMEMMSSSTVDQDKLLETMQSDKTALSRAMAQNKELKNQFLELQEQFVKMSQKNMDVMTKLQGEEHSSRELLQRFYTQEEELKQLRHLLEEKTGRLEKLEKIKENHHSNGMASSSEDEGKAEDTEKLAELFQRKVPLLESLQRELSSAQDTINALTNQNSELRNMVIVLEKTPPLPPPPPPTKDNNTEDSREKFADKAKLTQLEMEKQQTCEQLKESQKMQSILKEKIEQMQQDLAIQVPATMNGDIVTKVYFEALQHAMQQLEEKYTKIMRDKAELVDKTERLEHIVMQLQGETDTIGEYVSLYHHQRYLMKQRTAEKDCHITRLSTERLEFQQKFKQLQSLVVQLLKERNVQVDDLTLVTDLSDHQRGPSSPTSQNPVADKDVERSDAPDWPDYSESSDDDSQLKGDTKEIVNQSDALLDQSHQAMPSPPATPTYRSISKPPPTRVNIPPSENTAQKIINLLHEIDSSTSSELLKIPFFCPNCIGDILVV